MLYALLCYAKEDVVMSWSQAEDEAVMARLDTVHGPIAAAGRLGPTARLMPTTAATTLIKGEPPLIIDGPYAETKEQLLGFYLVDVENLEAALDIARGLAEANPVQGGYEVRPVRLFVPGSLPVEGLAVGSAAE